MSLVPRLLVNNLSFHFANTTVLFRDISLSFESFKYGIVGDNGVGKTTLLKLLSGEFAPESGSVVCNGNLVSMAQSKATIAENATVGDVLGVSKIIDALQHVNSGDFSDQDFEIIGDGWDIENRIKSALKYYHLSSISMDTPFSLLSGGQKTKVLLAKMLIFPADFILMDEPTNNLDKISRQILYQFVDDYPNGTIIVSHDRALLNKMDYIIEITTKGIYVYGGNYDFYREQKDIVLSALEKELDHAKRTINQVKQSIQNTKEKHERSAGRGRQAFLQGHVDKLTARSKEGRSQQSKARHAIHAEKTIAEKQKALTDIREKIEIKNNITGSLDNTKVPNGKVVLEIENVCFKYPKQTELLINNFNVLITGPERIAIIGKNGAGKSTLIKLIRNILTPLSGKIKLGVENIAYLDQELIILDEPTNHLDMQSIEAIENILSQYQGSIIAVSHDDHFLKNIHIERTINL